MLLADHAMGITCQEQTARKGVTRNISLSALNAPLLHLSSCILGSSYSQVHSPLRVVRDQSIKCNPFIRDYLHRLICLAIGKDTFVRKVC